MNAESSNGADALAATSRLWLGAGKRLREHDSDPTVASTANSDHLSRIMPESPPWVASGKLMAAYDAARAAGVLWRAGEVHLVADYALLRVIIEAAALSWWITSAPTAADRVTRAYRVTVDDLTSAVARETAAVKHAQTPPAREKRAEAGVRAAAERNRVIGAMRDSAIEIPARYLKGETSLRMIRLLVYAEQHIPAAGDLGYSLLWSITSNSAHGSLSAVSQLSTPAQRAGEPLVYSNPESVATFALQTAHLLNAAHKSWNRYAGHTTAK
jgi:hypothetical protein